MTMRTGQISLRAVAALLLALCLFALEAGAQPAGKVPPQLPPQAADKAKETVQAQTAPTVSLTAPSAGTLYTAPATVLLQATASASSSGKSIAQVEFFAGTTLIGTSSSAPYSFNWTPVAAGAYSLTARATDNLGAAATSTAVAITVNAPPTVNLTSPGNAAVFNAPATIPLTAAAADLDGTIARVEFYNGTSLIATLTAPPYSINWLLVPAGGYSLTARAIDNLGAVTTSATVAVTVTQALAQIYFIHTDHLNTPRAIYNQGQQLVWRWDQTDPFGGTPPNENPSGQGNFTCNLRLPGQYFDKETNLHYNYFRDYDPAIGRYIQSDPIGLRADPNTYAHVLNNPLSYIDPFGLDIKVCFYSDAAGGFGHIGYGVGSELKTFGFYPTGKPYDSPGQILEDVQKFKECKVIQANSDEDRCMLECRTRRASNPGTFNLSSRQCTSFVRECLKECGLPTGNFVGNPPWRFYQQLPTKR